MSMTDLTTDSYLPSDSAVFYGSVASLLEGGCNFCVRLVSQIVAARSKPTVASVAETLVAGRQKARLNAEMRTDDLLNARRHAELT